IAGGIPTGLPATSVSLTASALDYDAEGNLFIADPGQGLVWKVAPDGTIGHVAGLGRVCVPDPAACANEGGPATEAFLRNVSGLVVAPNGDLFISEQRANLVRRIDADSGTIHTVAGTGEIYYDPDAESGPATEFAVGLPGSLDMDSQGNLYITSKYASRVYRMTPDGTISTVAGCGSQRWPDCFYFAQDGSPVESTPINSPLNGSSFAIAIGPNDQLYIGDTAQIIKLDEPTNSYRIIAGKGFDYASVPGQGEGGPAIDARFSGIVDLDFDPSGNLFVMEGGGSYDNPWNRIQMIDAPVTPQSTLRHVAGTGTGGGYSGDGGPAKQARFSFSQPTSSWSGQGIAAAPDGDVVVGDYWNSRVRRVDAATKTVNTIAGNGYGGPGDYHHGLVHDLQPYNNISEGLWPQGGLSGDGGPAAEAQLFGPVDVEIDRDGNLYVLDRHNYRVRRISPSGTITTVVGSGCAGQACAYPQQYRDDGDGKPATGAALSWPTAIALDRTGTQLYIIDRGTRSIRQVNLGSSPFTAFPFGTEPVVIRPGEIESIVGPVPPLSQGPPLGNIGRPGTEGMSHEDYNLGDYVGGLAADSEGNLFFSETSNAQVMRLDAITGVVTAVAGVAFSSDCQGAADSGTPGRSTLLCGPTSLEVSGDTLYVAETGWESLVSEAPLNGQGTFTPRIRAIDLSTPAWIATVIAGNGNVGPDGDGGPATQASLGFPHGIEVGPDGSVYVADTGNSRIRRITPDGKITTVAGGGETSGWGVFSGCGYGGDGGPASEATLCAPIGLAMGPGGTLYVADQLNNRIRVIEGL
ncbi:MAG TPA: hypothetical protein VGB51_03860, partial [Actinomycetota bacterium]